MSSTRDKWNRIYRQRTRLPDVAAVISDNLEHLPTRGHCLDIACGAGGNALYLARLGLRVDAWDISDVATRNLNAIATAEGLDLNTRAMDIGPQDLELDNYDLIINIHYLDRDLFPVIINSLRPNGVVCIQTFTYAKAADIGPSNPEFLLKRNELLSSFASLAHLAYRDESNNPDRGGPMAGKAYLVAKKIDSV